MKPTEVSQEEAYKRLEQAVDDFDWIKEFLGLMDRDDLLVAYRGLHAQLREGDELKFEVVKMNHETNIHDIDYPSFSIVLYREDNEPMDISPHERLLYRGIE